MPNITFTQNSDKIELQKLAAKSLNKKISQALDNDEKVLLMLSGGSALKILDYIDTSEFNENIWVSVLDERFDSDPKINNFLQITQTKFYKECEALGVQFIKSVPAPDQDLDDFTQQFKSEIDYFIQRFSNRKIFITQGIGSDGHTAGIMPFPNSQQYFNETFNSDELVVGYDATGKNPYPERMTVTNTFLQKYIDYSAVYAVGENKWNYIKEVLDNVSVNNMPQPLELNKKPLNVIYKMKNVEVFTNLAI